MTLPKLEQKRPYLMHRHHALSKTLNTVRSHEGWIESLGDVGSALKAWGAAIIEDLGGEVSAMELSVIELATKTHLLLASVDRFLLGCGLSSIQAGNSLERMLAHQLAAVHKLAMEQMGQVTFEQNATVQAKRLNAAARCMPVHQNGLPALHKTLQNEQQRIMVQYVNVNHPSQAVIGNLEKDNGRELEPQPAMPMR